MRAGKERQREKGRGEVEREKETKQGGKKEGEKVKEEIKTESVTDQDVIGTALTPISVKQTLGINFKTLEDSLSL